MRHTRSHTGNRRSHHAATEPRLSKCSCGAFYQRHRACQECGQYRGRQVIDVVARTEREAKRAKRRDEELRSMGAEPKAETPEQETTSEKQEALNENK